MHVMARFDILSHLNLRPVSWMAEPEEVNSLVHSCLPSGGVPCEPFQC